MTTLEPKNIVLNLSSQQQQFVITLVSQALMNTHSLLKSGNSASGYTLGRKDKGDLDRFAGELRDLLLALGASTAELNDIARRFGPVVDEN